MMSWRTAQIALLVLCTSLRPNGFSFPQISGENASRTLQVGAASGQPSYTLRISAKGREGLVEVRGGSKALVQTLTCPLLQGISNPSDLEIKGAAEQFVTHFETEDLNLDGYPDLKGPREFGASWSRYCVWLFDPATRSFQKGFLTEQLELLYHLRADSKRGRIISYSIGPVNPLWDEYRIESESKDRPYWPRLIPVESCFIKTGPTGENSTAVITRYERDRSVIVRRPLPSNIGMPEACDSFGNR
jgi:hypothetical protein